MPSRRTCGVIWRRCSTLLWRDAVRGAKHRPGLPKTLRIGPRPLVSSGLKTPKVGWSSGRRQSSVRIGGFLRRSRATAGRNGQSRGHPRLAAEPLRKHRVGELADRWLEGTQDRRPGATAEAVLQFVLAECLAEQRVDSERLPPFGGSNAESVNSLQEGRPRNLRYQRPFRGGRCPEPRSRIQALWMNRGRRSGRARAALSLRPPRRLAPNSAQSSLTNRAG